MVCVHFVSVPTRVGDHDGGDTSDDRVVISRHMDAHQPMSINDCIVSVDSHICSTITDIVLCACSNLLTSRYKSDIRVSSIL